MNKPRIDLTNCADEPIHLPGAVQPHGVLLAADAKLIIRQVSANAGDHLELSADDLLGRRIGADLIGEGAYAALLEGLESDDVDLVNPLAVVHGGHGRFDGVVHRSGNLVVLELEPVPKRARPLHTWALASQRSMHRFQDLNSIQGLLEAAVEEVRALTGFDRVMAYRFHPDDSGEVVAEAKRGDLDPYLGQRYPESDIPAQARRLYVLNLLRMIADVGYRPQPIVPAENPVDGGPLDLSHSVLRSVSPIHLEYLVNLGVAASMSISLVVGGRLWGMIACHHTTPRFVPYPVRMSAKLVGRTLALLVGRLEHDEAMQQRREMNRIALELQARVEKSEDLLRALTQGSPTVLDYLDAGGAAVSLDNRIVLLGEAPDLEFAARLVEWLQERGPAASYSTHRLSDEFEAAAEQASVASGLLAIPFHPEKAGWVLWFRPEQVQVVRWGGDPNKPPTVGPHGSRLTPRGSFEEWIETVRRTAVPWTQVEVDEAEDLRGDLAAASLRQAEEVERTRNLFLGILGHDLRAPLQAISMSAELLRLQADQVEDSDLSDTISRSSRRMARLIDHLLDYSRIKSGSGLGIAKRQTDVRKLVDKIVDENRLAYPGMEIEVEISGDALAHCDPDRIEQVIANLLSNARHHGRVGMPAQVRLDCEDDEVVLTVVNQGDPIPDELRQRLFTAYSGQVDEAGTLRSGGLGLGLFISHEIVADHGGRIEVESNAKSGTRFRVFLPRREEES